MIAVPRLQTPGYTALSTRAQLINHAVAEDAVRSEMRQQLSVATFEERRAQLMAKVLDN